MLTSIVLILDTTAVSVLLLLSLRRHIPPVYSRLCHLPLHQFIEFVRRLPSGFGKAASAAGAIASLWSAMQTLKTGVPAALRLAAHIIKLFALRR